MVLSLVESTAKPEDAFATVTNKKYTNEGQEIASYELSQTELSSQIRWHQTLYDAPTATVADQNARRTTVRSPSILVPTM